MKCLYQIADYPVYRFSMPVIDSSMYLVPAGESCLVVDPCISQEAEALLEKLEILECLVLLTHEHYDHISGVNRLRELLPCQVVCTESCGGRIGDPRKNCAAYSAALVVAKSEEEQAQFLRIVDTEYTCQTDRTYSGHMELWWQDLTLTLRETPGHSPGSQIIEIERRWYFTGDSLIPDEKVITRFPGGSRKAYKEITQPLLEAIPPGSILFPGHGKETVFGGRLEGAR